jgi:excisionase family DNA binding protein
MNKENVTKQLSLGLKGNTQPVNTQLVDRKTAAEFLGVKANTLTLWAMRRNHSLPYIKLGRLVRYRMSDLEAFLEQNLKHKPGG